MTPKLARLSEQVIMKGTKLPKSRTVRGSCRVEASWFDEVGVGQGSPSQRHKLLGALIQKFSSQTVDDLVSGPSGILHTSLRHASACRQDLFRSTSRVRSADKLLGS